MAIASCSHVHMYCTASFVAQFTILLCCGSTSTIVVTFSPFRFGAYLISEDQLTAGKIFTVSILESR